MMILRRILAAAVSLSLTLSAGCEFADTTLLNVSYDPTRELYQAVNEAFIKDWKAKTGQNRSIRLSRPISPQFSSGKRRG